MLNLHKLPLDSPARRDPVPYERSRMSPVQVRSNLAADHVLCPSNGLKKDSRRSEEEEEGL